MTHQYQPSDYNSSAFGPSQVQAVLGSDWGGGHFNTGYDGYGGTAATHTGTTRPPNTFRLGAVGDLATSPDSVSLTLNPSMGTIALGYGAMGLGGGATGYLASGGTTRGAMIGALVHWALFSFGSAFAGRGRLSTTAVLGFSAVGLASAGGVGYLFMKSRRRRR